MCKPARRPLTVTANGKTTAYIYGADGTRIKKIEDQGGPNEVTTAYFGPYETRNFSQGTAEEILTYPIDGVRITHTNPGSGTISTTAYLHRDQLASVRSVTDASGALDKHSSFTPFGVANDVAIDPAMVGETKGWIGERYDADAGELCPKVGDGLKRAAYHGGVHTPSFSKRKDMPPWPNLQLPRSKFHRSFRGIR